MDQPKRGRGRPPGAKNRPRIVGGEIKGTSGTTFNVATGVLASAVEAPVAVSALSPTGTTRATLEADRDRLLLGIKECSVSGRDPFGSAVTVTDWKTVAALQSQLNGVNRMLLRITGETAPTDANLIRSPQYVRLKADLLAVLKKHPAALADVAKVFDTAE